jgi:hypothetical protein
MEEVQHQVFIFFTFFQLDGNNWARASVVNKYNMRWGESINPKAIELEAFLIDWGYYARIDNIVSNVRLIPESSNLSQIKGLASRITIDCKFILILFFMKLKNHNIRSIKDSFNFTLC